MREAHEIRNMNGIDKGVGEEWNCRMRLPNLRRVPLFDFISTI